MILVRSRSCPYSIYPQLNQHKNTHPLPIGLPPIRLALLVKWEAFSAVNVSILLSWCSFKRMVRPSCRADRFSDLWMRMRLVLRKQQIHFSTDYFVSVYAPHIMNSEDHHILNEFNAQIRLRFLIHIHSILLYEIHRIQKFLESLESMNRYS